MKKIFWLVIIFYCSVSYAQVGNHPKLFFGGNDIANIRVRVNQGGSTAKALYGDITKQRDYLMNNPLFTQPKWRYYEIIPALAFSYLITGDTNYSHRAKSLILDPNPDPNLQGIIYDALDGSGLYETGDEIEFGHDFRVNALSLVYDFMYDQLDANQRQQIQSRIISDINTTATVRSVLQQPNAHLGNNHLIHAALPLLTAAITIYGENSSYTTTQADADIDLAKRIILTNSDSYVQRMWSPEDGAYTEGISYNFWGGNQIAQFLELLSRLEGVNYFQQEAVKNRFTKLFDWLAYEVLPQPRNLYNYFNDLNESYTFDMAKISTVMMFAAHYPDKASLASWIFANTAQNVDNLLPSVDQYQTRSGDGHSMLFILPLLTYNDVPPVDPSTLLQLSKYFYRDGLVYVRTSSSLWADQNDIQLAFTSSPAIDPVSQYFSIKHDHADKNHFTLSAYGVQYLVDAGAGDQYNATWQSQYHNIVLIDNVGEAEGGWYERDGRIASYSKSPLFETMHGDARLAYNQLHYENGGVHLIATDQSSTSYRLNPVLNADRYVNFIRADASLPAYIVIADDINKDNGSHRYDWLIHTYQSEGPGNPLTLNAGNGNYLNIYYTASASTSVSTVQFSNPELSNLTALDDEGYGTPTPQTPPSSYSITTTAVNPFFHVVLFPVKTGLTLPTVQSLMTTNGSSFALDWGGTYSDQSVFRYNDGIVASPNVSTDAKIALVRVNKSLEMPETFSVTDGSQLTYNGQTIANLFGQVGTIMQSRTEVEMYGPAITDFYIYAPIAASVKINDITVSFVRNGNYVQSTDIVNIPSSLSPYWNMVSLPLTPLNFAKAAVWPTATSPAWAYPPGGTVATDPLVLGQGYWTEFGSSAQGINYLGLPVGVQSIPVYNASGNFGWNLIGTISTPVDISTITSIPSGNLTSGYFGFNPSAGYYLVQTLQPGNAYWVKVAQNGTLTLGTSGYSPPPPITLSQPPNPVDAPPIPTLSYPQNGTTSVPIPTTLSWFEADEAATSHLQVASDSLFTNVVDNEVGLTQTTQTISDVSYATKYYWRVNCTDTATSDWSNAKWFTTEVQPPPPPPPPPGGCTNCCAYSTMTLDQLTVTDAGGYSQSMYTLNSGRSTNWRFNNFDMPPAPPKGNIFHAHFQSGKFIEFIPPHNSVTTIPIVMKNVKYPVNLSWNIRKENNASYWYTNSKQKKVAMAGSGSAVIQSTNNGTLVITAQASQPCLPIDTRSARQEDADETSSIPTSYALIQNYPNPFNPITSIEYDLPKTGYVRLVVYDVLGRIVATLVNGVQAAGYRTVSFDGSRYPSGIYFYRIQAEGFMDVKKMALAK